MPAPEQSERDLQQWLKEAEEAERMMDAIESKADGLQAKVDALLADMTGQPTKGVEASPPSPSSPSS
ncbi:hypothetical protein BDF14DRAFT_1734271 [Spinellus fusiger]|nr:hypothetical protein BDF14DRAFT_1734271 [Spinellus fusiger]